MKNKINSVLLIIISLIVFINFQSKSLIVLGSYWDDLGYIETSKIIIDKSKLFFKDFNNSFLGEFNYNLEFYGYLIPITIYLISNNYLFLNSLKIYLLKVHNYSPLTEHDLLNISRFLIFNILVFILFLWTYKIYSNLYSKKYSIMFILLLITIPSFYGHLLFNLKDIPFAFLFFISNLYLIKYKKYLFDNFWVSKRYLFFISILFSLLLLIRFSGILFFLFSVFLILVLNWRLINKNIFTNLTFIFLIGVIITFVLSPSSWRYPFKWLRGAIETQFFLDWGGSVLTNGKFLIGKDLPPTYLFEWLIYKLPLNIIFFFIISVFYIIKKWRTLDEFSSFIFIQLITITGAFYILTPVSYDGIRQYLFLIPMFVHFVVLIISKINFLNLSFSIQITIFILSIMYMINSQKDIYPFNYLYFNEVVEENKISIECDEVSGCGNWESDYWGLSGKSIIKNTQDFLNNDEVYFCQPEQVFTDYLKVNIDKNTKSFWLYSIHRPGEINNLCNKIKSDLTSCKLFYTEKVLLRNTFIDVSHLYKCIKN